MSTHTAAPLRARSRATDRLADVPSLLLRYGMVVVLVVMVAVTAILDSSFLETNNLLNLLLEWAPVGLMAIGMTYVIIAGGFDLSVGGTYALGGVIFAAVANHQPIWLALIAALAAGVVIGIANGLVITRLDVNPFVATLGTGFVVRGLALVATSATPILVSRSGFDVLGTDKIGPFPIPAVLLIAGLVVGGFVLARTVYGTFIYAVGGNEESARLSGLPTRRIKASAYVLTGVGAALAGCILASRLSSGQADVGDNIELDVITVVVVGGTALAGGDGAMWRTAVGISILAILGNAFDRLQINPFWQLVIRGAIIVFAIAADAYAQKRAARTRREERRPAEVNPA